MSNGQSCSWRSMSIDGDLLSVILWAPYKTWEQYINQEWVTYTYEYLLRTFVLINNTNSELQ